jgi:hypothetical protein
MPLTITINEAAPGTLTIGVGTPGVGVPAGGTSGQVLQKLSATNYDTGWATPSADYITAVTAPLAVASGNLSVNLSAYLTTATAASTYYLQTNPAGYQTAGDLSSALSAYLLTSTAASTYYPLVGNPSGFLTSAPVTSVAGMTGAVLLANTDISGLGTMATATAADYSTTVQADGLYYPLSGNPSAFLTDAPSDGSTYGRNNGAWAVAGGGYITSVTSPLSVTSNDLSVDLSAYLPLAGGTMAGYLYSNIGNGMDSVMTEGNFKVKQTGVPTDYGELTFNTLRIQNSVGSMVVGPDMITFPNATTQSTAGIDAATANALYYPLSGNPSGFLSPDAPSDGTYYARQYGAWAAVVPEAPSNGTTYGRNNAAWVATVSNPGFTNSVWTGSTYVSANVTNIYDTGTMMYYNVLTF